ncbi:glycerate kinase [Micromonospora tulbaghiae]|uniref:glycerate kinase n=1 Tax=Micromonospora tulbaghiae TaxID=479978 RepID=UPI00369A5387
MRERPDNGGADDCRPLPRRGPARRDGSPGLSTAAGVVRVLVATDKFRGFASGPTASRAIAAGLRATGCAADVRSVGDGGEGTIDAVWRIAGGHRTRLPAVDAWGRRVEAQLLRLPTGETLIEAADVLGVANRPDPAGLPPPSTALGELIRLVAPVVRDLLVVCLGGTAVVDGGIGACEALRWQPWGPPTLVAADVDIPYASVVGRFGAQKGVPGHLVDQYESELRRASEVLRARSGRDVAQIPRAGAGGGLAGALACLGADVRGGFATFDALTGFSRSMGHADVLVTGEGRVDESTWLGKAPGELLRAAHRKGMPAGLVAGAIDDGSRTTVGAMCRHWVALNEQGSASRRTPEVALYHSGAEMGKAIRQNRDGS